MAELIAVISTTAGTSAAGKGFADYAVGQCFEDFSQVSDDEAIALLRHSSAMATPGAPYAT